MKRLIVIFDIVLFSEVEQILLMQLFARILASRVSQQSSVCKKVNGALFCQILTHIRQAPC